MKYTQSNLDKLQGILGDADYVIRYERGTFQSGWCLLQQKRVVVLNKFLNVEGRINTLLEIIPQLDIEYDRLTHESQKLYDTVKKRAAEILNESEAAAAEEKVAAEEKAVGEAQAAAVANAADAENAAGENAGEEKAAAENGAGEQIAATEENVAGSEEAAAPEEQTPSEKE